MAKSYNRQKRDMADYWDDQEDVKPRASNADRRKEKRVRAALRSKDINSLLKFNEEY